MASGKRDHRGPRLTDEMIVTRPLAALVIGAGMGAVGMLGGLGDASAQSKEGIIILDTQAISPSDPDKPAQQRNKGVRVNPTDPDKPARTRSKAARINPIDPSVNPDDPNMPAWAREVFGGKGGGGGGGGR